MIGRQKTGRNPTNGTPIVAQVTDGLPWGVFAPEEARCNYFGSPPTGAAWTSCTSQPLFFLFTTV